MNAKCWRRGVKRERGQKIDFSRQNGDVTVDKKQNELCLHSTSTSPQSNQSNILPTSIKDEGRTWKFFIPVSFKLSSYSFSVSPLILCWDRVCQTCPVVSFSGLLLALLTAPHPPTNLFLFASCCGNPVFSLALNTFHKPVSKGAVTHTLGDAHTQTHTRMQHMHTLW